MDTINTDGVSGNSVTPKHPNPDHAQRYHSRAYMEKEWRYLWPNVWLFAGLESDVAERGDLFKFDIGHESIIVVRGEDDKLRAFYNVCPHRATPLVREDFGSVRQLICPLHSWRFGLNGKNVAVTDPATFRPEILCNDLDLSAVRLEVLGGLVFVTMNPKIEPLRQWLGPVADVLETYGMGARRPVQHQQSVWAANWKTCFDVFAEVYHLHAVHPQTLGVMGDMSPFTLYPRGMSSMFTPHGVPAPRYSDQAGLNDGLRVMLRDVGLDPAQYEGRAQDVRGAIQAKKREQAANLGRDYSKLGDHELTDVMVINIFPNLQISQQLEATYLIRFMPEPNEPTQFIYDSITLAPLSEDGSLQIADWIPPSAFQFNGDLRPDIERVPLGAPLDLGLLLNQDTDIVPVLQRGYQSRGFRGPLFSEQELRLQHFHAELDRYIAGERE